VITLAIVTTISVALCTYDGGAYLARQLRSLGQQTRVPQEVVAFDDVSTDNTVALLEQFSATAPFPVRMTVNPQRLGITRNFEAAIAACSGDVIAPCDQDDVWYPEKLETIATAFEKREASLPPDMVFSDADVVDQSLRPLGYRLWDSVGLGPRQRRRAAAGRLVDVLVKTNVVTGAAMAFVTRHRDLLLPIPEGWLHDGWIALILSAVGQCQMIQTPLLAYRQHGAQQIGGRRLSFSQQITIAREMDAAYFDRLADGYATALDRLAKHAVAIRPDVQQLLRDKLAHCRAKADMRRDSLGWIGPVAKELTSGRYRRCSLGWKSVAQDLWLR
jgi:glycosyltransferase involved in cell wall biosynthesis